MKHLEDESIGFEGIWQSFKNVWICGNKHFIEDNKNPFLSKFKELNGFEKFENYFEKTREFCSYQEIKIQKKLINIKNQYETQNITYFIENPEVLSLRFKNLDQINSDVSLEKIWGEMEDLIDNFFSYDYNSNNLFAVYSEYILGVIEKLENSIVKTKDIYIKKEQTILNKILFWKYQS